MQVNNGAVLSVIPLFSGNGKLRGSDALSGTGFTFGGGVGATAVGTQNYAWFLTLASAATRFAIVDQIAINAGAVITGDVYVGTHTDPGSNTPWQSFDQSAGITGSARLNADTTTDVLGQILDLDGLGPGSSVIMLPYPVILRPGYCMRLRVTISNASHSINLAGREFVPA